MTDDQNPSPRPDQVGGGRFDDGATDGERWGDLDPIPADDSETDPRSAEIDYSVWMRPAVGEPQRTSEVVGALAPPEPDLVPEEDPIDVFEEVVPETPEEEAQAAQDVEGQALSPEYMAAMLGARASLAREEEPGRELFVEPIANGSHAAPSEESGGGLARLLPWLAAALALALITFGFVYSRTSKKPVIITNTPTPTASTPPVVDDGHLMTARDAEAIVPKQGWQVATTVSKLTPTSLPITCQNSTTGQPNPTAVRQRGLTTKSANALVALHQIDGFATMADARNAYSARAARMATCDDVPTWIHSAATVKGFGDEATMMTIVYQDLVPQYHTVLLSRTGTVVHAYDVSQAKQPVPFAAVVKGARNALNRQCATSGGECARTPVATPSVPPVTGSPGWLISSDLPRVTPGAGLWTSTDTTNVTTKGSQCENTTLAAAPGASTKEQRTYLLTQDSAAPQTFGIDEVVLTFATPKAASDFAEQMRKSLGSCPNRTPTAKVSETGKIAGKAGKSGYYGRTTLVQQSMGGTETARFRVAVLAIGNKVIYLVNNPSASYDLGDARMVQIASRAAERVTQA